MPDATLRDRMPDRNGVTRLFKYRPCVFGADSFGYLTDLLLGRLWFSPLGEFNDPFEGRPRYVPAFEDPEKQRDAMIRDVKRIARERGMKGKERHDLVERIRNRRVDFMKLSAGSLQDFLRTECYVYSLSANGSHPLMWSHYAYYHTGVCVEFDAALHPFRVAMRVDCLPEYPAIKLPRTDNLEDTYTIATLRKADYWGYEAEYRLTSVRGEGDAWKLDLEWDEARRIAFVNPAAIVGLTLGANMKAQTRDGLRAWRDANRRDLPLVDARLSGSEFRIEAGDPY